MREHAWIFGYGSLVWRPAFPYEDRRPAYISGYVRRFWQASADHRGTPAAPGRVATLVEEAGGVCGGMAYRVGPEVLQEVLKNLDHRERGGYRRVRTSLYFHGRREPAAETLLYLAEPDNPNYVGPAPLEEIAEVVRRSHGPSGSNLEYVLRLAEALEELDALDDHVAELARLLRVG